jgi:hypothetical protein
MGNVEDSVGRKVAALFVELVGVRAGRLDASRAGHEAEAAIAAALACDHPERASDIAFHLADWGADAAFILALRLFPERFTAEEIREGVQGFLSHVPNHVAAAAHLSGESLRDVFGIGLQLNE